MSLMTVTLYLLLIRVTMSAVLPVENQNQRKSLEKCVNKILEHYLRPTDYLFFLNFDKNFGEINLRQPYVVVNKLQQLTIFQIFKANFYVVTATDLDALLNFWSSSISWNPRAPFLLIQEDEDDRIFNVARKHYVFNLTLLVSKNRALKIVTYLNESKTHSTCSDTFIHKVNIFPRRYIEPNLNFKLYYQTYPPFTFLVNSVVHGLDVVIFKLIQDAFNLSIEYVHSTEYSWGYKQPNGSYDGAYGLLEKNQVDMLMGGFMINETNTLDFEQIYPYMHDFYAWAVPLGEREPTWKKTLSIFSRQTWILTITFLIINSVLLYCLVLYADQKQATQYNYFLIGYKCILMQSVGGLPSKGTIRLIFGTWIFGSLIISSCFQGRLISALTFKTYDQPITNSDELMKSKLQFGYLAETRNVFVDNDKKSKYFSQNFYKCSPTDFCFKRVAINKDLALLDLEKTIIYWTILNRNDKLAVSMLNERLLSMYYTMVFKKGHPFSDKINLLMWHICSHGFMDFVVDGFYKYAEMVRLTNLEAQTVNPLKLIEISWIFWLHGFLLLVSSMCFILEVITKKVFIQKKYKMRKKCINLCTRKV